MQRRGDLHAENQGIYMQRAMRFLDRESRGFYKEPGDF